MSKWGISQGRFHCKAGQLGDRSRQEMFLGEVICDKTTYSEVSEWKDGIWKVQSYSAS